MRSIIRTFALRLAPLLFCALVFPAGDDPHTLWLDVPFVRQLKNGCGAASIAMVMSYWSARSGAVSGGPTTAEIMERIYSREAKGIFASGIETYLGEQGYRTFSFAGLWTDLRQHLSRGRPLIVCIREGSGDSGLHYVVVVGLDFRQSVVFLNDPASRKLIKMDRANFERRWNAAQNWTLLAVPETAH